jgi:hypothetical protein
MVQSMTEHASASQLHQSLLRLEHIWVEQGMPVVDHLAPGISPAELAAQLEPVGLQPPDELCTWYGWHNGLSESAMGLPRRHAEILPAGLPLSVAAGTKELRLNESIAPPPVWQPGWFPIVAIHHGASYMVDCRGWTDAPAQVMNFEFEDGGFESDRPRASSLTQVVAWWLECYEDGTYVWNTHGYFDVNEQKHRSHDMERLLTGLL